MGLPKNFMFKSGGGDNDAMNAGTTKAAAEPVKEKDFFDLKLNEVDAKAKIKIIKEVRAITSLGLKEVCCCCVIVVLFVSVFFCHFHYC
jgi:large subunit ribosomal protein L7/L12